MLGELLLLMINFQPNLLKSDSNKVLFLCFLFEKVDDQPMDEKADDQPMDEKQGKMLLMLLEQGFQNIWG